MMNDRKPYFRAECETITKAPVHLRNNTCDCSSAAATIDAAIARLKKQKSAPCWILHELVYASRKIRLVESEMIRRLKSYET